MTLAGHHSLNLSLHSNSKGGHLAQAWPISIFHPVGHHDWSKDRHVTQAGPMKVSPRTLEDALGKRSSLRRKITNCKVDGILAPGVPGTGSA